MFLRENRRNTLITYGFLAVFVFLPSIVPARERVRDTRFKYRRGFYSAPFYQVIRSKTPGAKIRYTTDGTAPTETHGFGDSNPAVVRIDTTTTLRAMAYKEGLVPTNVDTHTYIFLQDVLKQPREIDGYPNFRYWDGAGYLTLDYEMDPEIVNDRAHRRNILTGLKSIPTISIVMNKDDMFEQVFKPDGEELDLLESGVYYGRPGIGSIRPASVELIYPDGQRGFQVDCALESNGSHGIKRSFKVRFQKEFGPNELISSIFQQAPLNGESATNRIKRIVLRSGNTRSWVRLNPDRTCYTRDQWFRDSEIAMNGVGSHGTFVHLYINGLYWGLYNAVERPDAWFNSTYFGGEKEDWSAVNHRGLLQGNIDRWIYLRGQLKEKDLRTEENYEELKRYLDVVAYADYIILAWYGRLYDWGPDRNWFAGYRHRPPSPLRFFMWDTEYSWHAGSEPNAWVHPLYRRSASTDAWDMVGLWFSVIRSEEFMMLFADRVTKHCFGDGALTDDNASARWMTLNDFIDKAVSAESARWGDARREFGEPTRTREDTFLPNVERVVRMMTGNVASFIQALRKERYYPSIDPPEMLESSGWKAGVRFVNPNETGEMFYTLDGTDPRAPGGAVAETAIPVETDTEISISETTLVKARARQRGEWSALAERVVSRGFLFR